MWRKKNYKPIALKTKGKNYIVVILWIDSMTKHKFVLSNYHHKIAKHDVADNSQFSSCELSHFAS